MQCINQSVGGSVQPPFMQNLRAQFIKHHLTFTPNAISLTIPTPPFQKSAPSSSSNSSNNNNNNSYNLYNNAYSNIASGSRNELVRRLATLQSEMKHLPEDKYVYILLFYFF
jgi:hypothetical protein